MLVTLVSCGVGIGIGASGDNNAEPGPIATETTAVQVTATPPAVVETIAVTVTPEPPTTDASGALTTFGPGTWLVGTDVAEGTYRTAGEVSDRCYWKIAPSAGSSDILQNDIPGGGKPTVNITAGQEFSSSNCGDWVHQ